MKKNLFILIITILTVAILFSACSKEKEAGLGKDGTFTIEDAPDRGGWIGVLAITMKDGQMVQVDYDEVKKDNGKITGYKSQDAEYASRWSAVAGVDQQTVFPLLEAALLQTGDPSAVDAITGATSVSERFKALASSLMGGKSVQTLPSAGTAGYMVSLVQTYDDGTYRGMYGDQGDLQVGVQFRISQGNFSNLSYRYLYYKGTDYRTLKEGEDLYPILKQQQQALAYLDGKPVSEFKALYSPGDFVENIDGFSGATIRGNKVVSAIQDALNRGLYTPANGFKTDLAAYPDGRYRGAFYDGGDQQVNIQFDLKNNTFTNLSFRYLFYSGTNYRNLTESDDLYAVLQQHNQILSYLKDKPLSTIFDLYNPGAFLKDIDSFTGATIRANKVYSAIRDGLNRGLYTPAADVAWSRDKVMDGRYRGIFGDGGAQQISIQFSVKNNLLSGLSFRHLYYSGVDYRKLKEGDALYPVLLQHRQILEYFEGKDISELIKLYNPGSFIEDVDTFSGASIRGNKVFSAIIDGLNRGIY